MRPILALTSLAVISALASAAPAAPAPALRFTVLNRTESPLLSLFLSHGSGQDRRLVTFDRSPVGPGERVAAKVDPPDPRCQYDVHAVFQGGVETEQDGVDLCHLKAGALVLN